MYNLGFGKNNLVPTVTGTIGARKLCGMRLSTLVEIAPETMRGRVCLEALCRG